ncbi:MAG: DNA repair protein Rad50 [Oscillospiraceae bacterium]|nr:DNA repair protein Rad50 [Oscillospiraceae bacterium]MDD4510903.1 DNA repair protein Rad50 [Oscillospiraceae bacterium]
MIILDVKLNNLYGFKDFNIAFSYPKKIVNSIIENEHVAGRPNFRYKKAVILMGANATGKTSLGKALLNIISFINTGDTSTLASMAPVGCNGSFQIDFVNNGFTLHRVSGKIGGHYPYDGDPGSEITIEYSSTAIGPKDSYEMCVEKLIDQNKVIAGDYAKLGKMVGKLDFTFSCPDIKPTPKVTKVNRNTVLKTLKAVIGTLDPTLTDVRISKDLRNSFIIRRNSEEIIIQDGKLLNRESLSSGTAEGVDISFFLAILIAERNGFYYCDEHFSYIQSDIEKRIFGLMLEHLDSNEQLIFTTHNTDMLDLNIPKHCFAFLRKKQEDDYRVSVTYASDILKRNSDSIRCAVENDVFSSLPDESALDALEKGADDEE